MRAPAVFAVIAVGIFVPAIQWAQAAPARTVKSAPAAARQTSVGHPKRVTAPHSAPILGGPGRYNARSAAVIGGAPLLRKR